MFNIRKPIIIAPLFAAVLLGGCATYGQARPSYSYFAVPCDTPGAIRGVPVSPPDGAPAAAPDTTIPPRGAARAVPGVAPQAGAGECLVAVANGGRGWGQAGYYGGYYPRRYYGSPYYGSFGIGIGIGGHSGGGHYRGGHSGGSHGGGHGGGGHH